MRIIKRNGTEVEFDSSKINIAVHKANKEAPSVEDKMTDLQVDVVTEMVTRKAEKLTHTPTIEEIQDMVIHAIMQQQAYVVAQLYTEYRYKKALIRKANTTDENILSLVNYENEEIKQENSNKNPVIASTQRDYTAGEVSKDITDRLLLDSDIVDANKKGIIHFHDRDYFLQKIHNCDLINLEDMLQNGTVISEVQIDKPNSLATACNIATQIVAQVASSQYGQRMVA